MIPYLPATHWLASIHHDGSDLHVSNPYPRLGERVRLRLRVSSSAPVRHVYLRTFPDGEQAIAPMQPQSVDPPVSWWEIELPILEPVVQYRFILAADDGIWHYSASGPAAHDPLDAFDFRLLADYEPPSWVHESVFYQIFPDRFANGDPSNDPRSEEYDYRGSRPVTLPWGSQPPAGQHVSLTFYGGDLQGIRHRLDYIQSLGINALYLTPVFTAYSNHKYDVIDYEHVDPHFGGDQALVALRQALDEAACATYWISSPTTAATGIPGSKLLTATFMRRKRSSSPSIRILRATSPGWACGLCRSSITRVSSCAAASMRASSPSSGAGSARPSRLTAGGWTWPTCSPGKAPAR